MLVRTLRAKDMDARLVEGLPWVLVNYRDLDWDWLVREAKANDLQNRLGFLVSLARGLARRRGDSRTVQELSHWQEVLERSRLQREDAFRESLTDAERQWLRTNRSAEAARWNVLSTLTDAALEHGF
jgi:hypothetical protein